jgi:hypothetical protein
MSVKLKKFLLRYYPPGLILEYERDGVPRQKTLDLLDIMEEPSLDDVITRLIQQVGTFFYTPINDTMRSTIPLLHALCVPHCPFDLEIYIFPRRVPAARLYLSSPLPRGP